MIKSLKNEHGAVLVAGLMILVILSMLGITTLQTSTIEEKMANNMGQRHLAFQAAEAALRVAETRLINNDDDEIDPALPVLIPKNANEAQWWDIDATWTGASSVAMSDGGDGLQINGVSAQPRFIVEFLRDFGEDELNPDGTLARKPEMYRVTARGVGVSTTAAVILQITHLR